MREGAGGSEEGKEKSRSTEIGKEGMGWGSEIAARRAHSSILSCHRSRTNDTLLLRESTPLCLALWPITTQGTGVARFRLVQEAGALAKEGVV
ncbi:hypothetical protein Pmani_006091 [Petrolisthes manimaculis]|uniref:Uncharacterized protein n=1 Tax=Petrolisthes manimaculis TaxID=1843537 RepID=A0AAE1QAH8_9EUCA|nr:hypothetical protein Pmani_006091 [Petrolisthes manimaculis]